MVKEAKAIMSATKYKNNAMFYHDALSLMTNKDTMDWMRENDLLQHWILPEQNLFYDQPELKRYRGRPPGNCPELNSLDQSCNKDIHEAVNKHVALTLSLEDGDDRKFSLNTPTQAKKAYRRIFEEVAPEIRRIIQDRSNIVNSLKWIVKYKGSVVPDDDLRRDFETKEPFRNSTHLREGHRDISSKGTTKKANRGGARKRTQALDDYGNCKWHPIVKTIVSAKIKVSKHRYDPTDELNKAEYNDAIEEVKFKREFLEK